MKLSVRQSLLLILLVGIAVYANGFWGVFQLDDYPNIVENPAILNLWQPSHYLLYTCRPIVLFSLALNHAISVFDPWSYHLLNLLAHLAAAMTLFGLIRRSLLLPASGKRWKPYATELAFAVSLIWTIHPVQTQSVTYIIQRAESMMGLFYLITLYGLVRSATSARPGRWMAISILACFLGMATKPIMVTAPILALAYDRIFLSDSWRALWKNRGRYYAALASSWFLLGLLLFFGRNEFVVDAGFTCTQVSWLEYLRTQPEILLHYLRIILWPEKLVIDYGWPIARDWKQIVPAAAAVGGVLVLTLRWLKKNPPLGFLGLWFFVILAPTSSVIPIADLAFDHRLYLPLAAPWMLLALGAIWLIQKIPASILPHRRTMAWITLFSVVFGFSAMTLSRNQLYQREVWLWEDALAKRPPTARAYLNLSAGLMREKRFNEAIAVCGKALEFPYEKRALVYMNLGQALQMQNQLEEAASVFRYLCDLDPQYALARQKLADILMSQGRFSDAAENYLKVIRLRPENDLCHVNLGLILQRQKKGVQAMALYQKALKINPENVLAYNNIGALYYENNKPEEALRWFLEAIRHDPEYGESYSNAAAVYGNKKQLQKALELYKKALTLEPVSERTRQNYLLLLSEIKQSSTATK